MTALLTVSDVATRLALSAKAARRLIRQQRDAIRVYRIGHEYRIVPVTFEAWINKHRE